tara:strand:- start:246 stop:497 length:252 start_codon:yes stop_codon:yes gene_type:complete
MKKKKLVNDLVTVTGGMLKGLEGAKDYSKNKLRERFSLILEDLDFVKKEELNEIKAMLFKSRAELEDLKSKIIKIEKKFVKKK